MMTSNRSDGADNYETLHIQASLGDLQLELLLDSSFEPVPLDASLSRHNHYAFEVHYFLSGYGALLVDTTELPIEPANVLVIGPGVYHRFKEDADQPLVRYNIQFIFAKAASSDQPGPDSEAKEVADTLSGVRHFQYKDDGAIRQLMESLQQELETAALGRYSYIQSLFVQLIIHLVRSIKPDTYSYELPNKQKDDMRTRIIDMFFHDRKPLGSLEELAAELNLSVRQTNRVLQKYYNTSFKQKLLDTRLEIAKDLLAKSDQTVQQIAEQVGYVAVNNFHDIFVKKTGLTPAQYRKQHRPFS